MNLKKRMTFEKLIYMYIYISRSRYYFSCSINKIVYGMNYFFYFLRAFYNTLQCLSKCFLLKYVFRFSKIPSEKFKNCLEYYEEENTQKYMEHPLLLSVSVRLKFLK